MGGHGNGIGAITPDGQHYKLVKGCDLSVKKAARLALKYSKQGMHVLFHTRLASCGEICDELCQPFVQRTRSGYGLLCHNGHWSRGAEIARYRELVTRSPWSDSRVMSQLLLRHNWERLMELKLFPESGVILLLAPGRDRLLAIKPSWQGDLQYDMETGIWCSRFPGNWKYTYEVDTGVLCLAKVPQHASGLQWGAPNVRSTRKDNVPGASSPGKNPKAPSKAPSRSDAKEVPVSASTEPKTSRGSGAVRSAQPAIRIVKCKASEGPLDLYDPDIYQ